MVVKLKLKFVRSGDWSRERKREREREEEEEEEEEEETKRGSLGKKKRKTEVLREGILRESVS